MDNKRRIVLFTTFSDCQKAYSLNIVTQTQIKMLLMNNYQPVVIVHESFDAPIDTVYANPDVVLEKIPNMNVYNEIKKDENFDRDVEAMVKRLKEIIREDDIVITHDVIYQNACLKHNMAARKVAIDMPKVRWLHWIHSATSPLLLNMIRPIFSDEYVNLVQKPFPNSRYVYPNSYAVPAVAKNFGIPEEDVRVVPHATDICQFFNMPIELEEVVFNKGILQADAITVYPNRLDRGKQDEYVIKTMAMLKDFGLTVRVIIPDFHSTAGDKLDYRDFLKEVAIDYGLSSDELIFLSEQNPDWLYEVPQSIIASLQMISNVFIMPSVSETYSLITQEAGLTKQVVVLNQDFPPFRSIYGENAIYRKYSSRFDVMADLPEAVRENSSTNTRYGSDTLPDEARKVAEKEYHRTTAGMIVARLKHPEMAMSTFLRKKRNLQAVFKDHIEPCFYE